MFKKSMRVIIVTRIGNDVNDELMFKILKGVEGKFDNLSCRLLKQKLPIPPEAYNAVRKQYHSTRILEEVHFLLGKSSLGKVLAITNVDLYVPRMNFVFGEAFCPGKVALVSIYRLKPEFYGQPPNQALLVERTVKEAIHELGHAFGLKHCENPYCVMRFSRHIIDTDSKGKSFCAACAKSLGERVGGKP
jgi:archaemetzincin